MSINIKDLKVSDFFNDVNNNEALKTSYKDYVGLSLKLPSNSSKRTSHLGRELLFTYMKSHEQEYILERISNVPVESISVSPKTTKMKIGDKKTFTVTVLPENATNKEYTVTSGGSISVVDNTIEAKSEGSGIVTITSNENQSIKETINVTVEPKEVLVTSVKIKNGQDISALNIGDSVTLLVDVLPENATNKNVTWKSSNANVVSVDANGKVIAISEGASIISAESTNGIKGIANAKVLEPVVEPEPEPTEPEGSEE